MKKKDIINMQTIGVYSSGLYGLMVKFIDDYIYYVDSLGKPHRKKIYYCGNNENYYFIDRGTRIHLSEVLRCI